LWDSRSPLLFWQMLAFFLGEVGSSCPTALAFLVPPYIDVLSDPISPSLLIVLSFSQILPASLFHIVFSWWRWRVSALLSHPWMRFRFKPPSRTSFRPFPFILFFFSRFSPEPEVENIILSMLTSRVFPTFYAPPLNGGARLRRPPPLTNATRVSFGRPVSSLFWTRSNTFPLMKPGRPFSLFNFFCPLRSFLCRIFGHQTISAPSLSFPLTQKEAAFLIRPMILNSHFLLNGLPQNFPPVPLLDVTCGFS